jgi:hypothetical protein
VKNQLTKMSREAAQRIQSKADSAPTPARQEFKARAMSAAAKNEKD